MPDHRHPLVIFCHILSTHCTVFNVLQSYLNERRDEKLGNNNLFNLLKLIHFLALCN